MFTPAACACMSGVIPGASAGDDSGGWSQSLSQGGSDWRAACSSTEMGSKQ